MVPSQLKKVKAKINNIFWSEVVSSLILLNAMLKLTPQEIIREQIRFSDYTKYQTSTILDWEKKGLHFIGDLFNTDTGNLLTREEIKTFYRISMTFLCYESLIRSLPQQVRKAKVRLFEKPNIPHKLQMFFNSTNISKYSYSLCIKELSKKYNKSEANIRQKWIRDIGFQERGTLPQVTRATRSVYFIYLH